MARGNIVLGIGGGIAAYKTPALIRQLVKRGYAVTPVLTESAKQFVTPTTLASVSGQRVRDDLWDAEAEQAMGHIELARWADVVLIAPATANLIANFAHGLAPDLLRTLYLATRAPILVAPAMNQQMWLHSATQTNVRKLMADGVRVLGPDSGSQACGDDGPGRMLEPDELAATVELELQSAHLLSGLKVVVTAGPTREPIDAVRFLSNASSGRQGYAIARASRLAGAEVVLISGPVALDPPYGVECIRVSTAAEMHDSAMTYARDCDIFFSVAAVSDFRPESSTNLKIKKESFGRDAQLRLVENPDIVHSVARLENQPYTVGFAAETHLGLEFARAKRDRKQIDLIVLNDVSDDTIGFDSEQNEVTLIHEGGERLLRRSSKDEIAQELIVEVAALRHKKLTSGSLISSAPA